jgi:uncharacterized membrane protein YgdD (TMEM256/DUF423 family)
MRLGMLAALLGALAVALGAFGAHALRGRLEPADLALFETAARYQLLHALAAAFAADRAARAAGAGAACVAFLAGAVVFCGSLYGLALGGPRLLGAITPLGGLGFILGWLLLAWSFRRSAAGAAGG